MITKHAGRGVFDALTRFKVADAPPGILDKLKTFGQGQLGAAKSFAGNLHKGTIGTPAPPMLPEGHRAMALDNLRTLAPSLAVGGGAYLIHRHNQAKEDEARQHAMMMQQQGLGA